MSTLGVIMLLFLSGMSINFDLFKRHSKDQQKDGNKASPVMLAVQAFSVIVGSAVLLSLLLKVGHVFTGVFLSVIIFSTIALGVVIGTLREQQVLDHPYGQALLLTAVLGQVIPMLALTFYASINGGNAKKLWLLVFLFIAAIILLRRFKKYFPWFKANTKATTQLDVRLAFFLMFTLVTIATKVGAENILGAFLAGMVMKLLEPEATTQQKLASIGYGFLIPYFFIMTGAKLNLRELWNNPRAIILILLLTLCFVLVKLPTVLIYRQCFSQRSAWAGSFLNITTITLVLPILQVAQNLHAINNVQVAAFTLAAVLACIIGPVGFNLLFKELKKSKWSNCRHNRLMIRF